jgi:hypothetical protein
MKVPAMTSAPRDAAFTQILYEVTRLSPAIRARVEARKAADGTTP